MVFSCLPALIYNKEEQLFLLLCRLTDIFLNCKTNSRQTLEEKLGDSNTGLCKQSHPMVGVEFSNYGKSITYLVVLMIALAMKRAVLIK